MIKKEYNNTTTVSESVAFLLRSAKKRRNMAYENVRKVNEQMGIETRRLMAI